MFSSFSAYLFGSSSANVEDDCEKENEFTTVETDGDWLIVDSCKQETRLSPEGNEPHHQPLKANDNILQANDKIRQANDNIQKENVNTDEEHYALPIWFQHLRCPKMIEAQPMPVAPKPAERWLYDSWFITPPSCFNAGPACLVHTSPLENLLIEHPSMSVYTRINGGKEEYPQARVIQIHTDDSSSYDVVNPAILKCNRARVVQKEQEPPAPSGKAELLEYVKTMAGVQKVKLRQDAKFVHGKQLERHNKAQEFQSIGKRHRRKDFMKSPSGKSNNRKY